QKLIIIPDGILSFVPFQTLLTDKSKTHQYENMPFLIRKSTVSYRLSLRNYTRDNCFAKNQSVLGIFPVFKNSSKELTFSIDEANKIKELFPGKLLMNKEATKQAFLKESANYSI